MNKYSEKLLDSCWIGDVKDDAEVIIQLQYVLEHHASITVS